MTVVVFHVYCLKLPKPKISLSYTEKLSLGEKQEIPECQFSGFRRGIDEVFVLCVVKQCTLVAVYRRFGTAYRSHFQG